MTYQPPQKHNRLLVGVLVAVPVLLVFCLGGATVAAVTLHQLTPMPEVRVSPTPADSRDPVTQVTPPRAPRQLVAGETLPVTAEDGTSIEVSVRARPPRQALCEASRRPPGNGNYLLVDVTVKSIKGDAEISPFAFELRMADRSVVNPVTDSSCVSLGTLGAKVPEGQAVNLVIAFDVGRAGGDIAFKWPVGDTVGVWAAR